MSLLNIVLAGIVPGMQTVPSLMNHSFFTLSNTLISGLLAPFLGHLFFQMPWNIPQYFRFVVLQTWNRVALLIPRMRVLRFTKFVFFQYRLWYSGRSILSCLSLYSVCAIWEQPHSMYKLVRCPTYLQKIFTYMGDWAPSSCTGCK